MVLGPLHHGPRRKNCWASVLGGEAQCDAKPQQVRSPRGQYIKKRKAERVLLHQFENFVPTV